MKINNLLKFSAVRVYVLTKEGEETEMQVAVTVGQVQGSHSLECTLSLFFFFFGTILFTNFQPQTTFKK